MYSKDILTVVLEKFHEIPFTNKKVACRRQAMQRVSLKILRYLLKNFAFDMSMFFQEALLHDPKNKTFQRASKPDEFRSSFFQRR